MVYLACAAKSNAVYVAAKAAQADVREFGSLEVPMHLRNAPTRLMKDLGYGAGYRYDPDADGGVAAQTYLPDSLAGARFYEPGEEGREPDIARRLDRARQLRSAVGAPGEQELGGTDG